MKKPNLFLVGQPKSGTTALHYFLSKHPDIYMAKYKEPLFFCKDFHEKSDSYHGSPLYFHFRNKNSYLKLFANAMSEKVIGESSTGYLYSKVAASEIYTFAPDAKIIIMLREPVQFLYSLHNQYVNQLEENEKDFVKALALEPLRKEGKYIPKKVSCPFVIFYSERAKYYEQLKRFYDLFPKSNIKLIIYEDFRENNELIYREILDLLNLEYIPMAEYKSLNARSKPRSELLNQIVYHPITRKIAIKLLPPGLFELIGKNILEKFVWKRDNSRKIDDDIRLELMNRFKQEVIQTSELVGVNLVNKWGYDKL
ncbi:sulfotransferase [Crocosphaera sp. XPORK-15E]|uniref:sulfotransferase family protein n=1 Tax=Crocosphaera sp. XPORK-15E TaxID=3110247 RepID=UPI002B2120E5|nr:sulfotransferase [Crocosphaera sp. XPORK-15E]MEA5536085.1 sulfotransferase [Crocosphaera sp. XPORK-15E]